MSKPIKPKRGEPLTIWSTRVLENEDGELQMLFMLFLKEEEK